MREANIVTKIKTEAQKQLPGAVIFKLQDYMTTGIPDLVINFAKHVTYIEVKLLKPRESTSAFKKHFDKLQLATARLLDDQVGAYYFIAYPLGKNLYAAVVQPIRLAHFLEADKPNFDNLEVVGDFNGPINDAIDNVVFLARRGK